jgi:ribosomal protein L12E/L44/L45/RPP1/RPP2
MTTRIVRLSAFAAGLFIAAPALASVSQLCDGEHGKDKAENKEKTEKKEKQEEKKKPANPA